MAIVHGARQRPQQEFFPAGSIFSWSLLLPLTGLSYLSQHNTTFLQAQALYLQQTRKNNVQFQTNSVAKGYISTKIAD